MNIQFDVEMLSIQTLKYYTKAHKLFESDMFHLFLPQYTDNILWAESAGYIADRHFEEQENANYV